MNAERVRANIEASRKVRHARKAAAFTRQEIVRQIMDRMWAEAQRQAWDKAVQVALFGEHYERRR